MNIETEVVTINGVKYVPMDSISEKAPILDGMKYCIVRTYSAGVFAGYVESRNGQEVVIRHSRRIWYWDGASSLSQLANEGVKKPENCKFAQVVDRTELLQAIEIIDVTYKAKKIIEGVKVWQS